MRLTTLEMGQMGIHYLHWSSLCSNKDGVWCGDKLQLLQNIVKSVLNSNKRCNYYDIYSVKILTSLQWYMKHFSWIQRSAKVPIGFSECEFGNSDFGKSLWFWQPLDLSNSVRRNVGHFYMRIFFWNFFLKQPLPFWRNKSSTLCSIIHPRVILHLRDATSKFMFCVKY